MATWLIWAAFIVGIFSIVLHRVLNAPVGLIGATSYQDAIRQGRYIETMMRFTYQFIQGLVWFFEKVLYWPWRAGRKIVFSIGQFYYSLWKSVVIRKDGYSSKPRAGLMVTLTILFLLGIVPVLEFTGDALLFASTYDSEDVYLTNSQEIDPAHDIHSVKGCYTLPCTEDNALYFRVRPTAFNHAWSMFNHEWHGIIPPLFLSDYVAAAVPPVVSRCTVKSYGFRAKLLVRQWDWYPDMLDARCTPINNG